MLRLYQYFSNAVQFLTILPMPGKCAFHPRKMLPFFPLVGLLLGLIIGLFDIAAHLLWESRIVSILDLVLLIYLTYALHLDGVGDSADGFYGTRPKEKVLAIMKDSHLGTMGVVAIITVLSLKAVSLFSIHENRFLIWLLVLSYSRASVLFAIKILPYVRGVEGTGHALFKEPLQFKDFWGLFLIVPLSFSLGLSAILFNLFFLITNGLLIRYYQKKMNGITGDMLGAMIEINEAALLLILSAKVML